ncbi:pilus assembly protein PilP [Comamonadaceae bacterium M7527]|nr:pilus assembly protein PilP [Comamonadaceae bacterium M7527]
MNWAQLKDVDLLALPWGQVLVWPRRWQCALLGLVWTLALLVLAYVWYWPQQDLLALQAQQRAQRKAQQDSVQANLRARAHLSQQLAALQDRSQNGLATHADWLHLLEQLTATGVAVQQWRSLGQARQQLVFQGDWPAVYQALSGLSRDMLWGQLKLQHVSDDLLQASLDVQRHAQATVLFEASRDTLALAYAPSPFAELASVLPDDQQPGASGAAMAMQVQAINAQDLSRTPMHGRYQAQREQALTQPLSNMQLLGVVQTGKDAVALVLAGGHTWRVKCGQRLGAQGLRVQRITATAVQLGQGQTLVVTAQN